MTAPNTRTPEQVRKEIEAERERLAGAVEHLRSDLGEARNAAGRLKSRLPIVFVVAGGVGATIRHIARRGRTRRRKRT
jgi:hypothetical protein